MEKVMRFGIVGCGMISHLHAKALKERTDVVLTAVFDKNKKFADEFANQYGCSAYYDLDDMLESEKLDALCICSPSGFHAEQTIKACEAGLHVLVEKPMALNVLDAERVIEAAKENNVKVGVVSQLRFSPGIQQVKQSINTGVLGKMIFGNISMNYYRDPAYYAASSWKGTWEMDGGGALMNQGIHGIDLLRFLMGDVKSVSGIIRTNIHQIEVEDTAAAVVEYESGALGTITAATCCNPGQPRQIEIWGENGRIVVEEDRIALWEVRGTCAPVITETWNNQTANDPTAVNWWGHYLQLQDFVQAIRENREPISNAVEGMKTVKLICDIYGITRA